MRTKKSDPDPGGPLFATSGLQKNINKCEHAVIVPYCGFFWSFLSSDGHLLHI
jgi:hypothetical protein